MHWPLADSRNHPGFVQLEQWPVLFRADAFKRQLQNQKKKRMWMSWSRSCLQWLEALLCPSSSRRAAVKSGPGHSFIHLQFLFRDESSWWLESTAPGGQQFCTTRLFHCTGPHCLWTTHQLQKCQWDSSDYTTVGRKTGYNVNGIPWADLLWCRKTCLSASGTFWKHTLCLYSRKKKISFQKCSRIFWKHIEIGNHVFFSSWQYK